MSGGTLVFLVGLYVVPVLLLAWGHRLRRLPVRQRRAFWGAISGHCVAALLTLIAGMIPPESWSDASPVRGLIGFWSLALLPVVGAVLAAMAPSARRS